MHRISLASLALGAMLFAAGCGGYKELTPDQSKVIDVYSIDYQLKRLEDKDPGVRAVAMAWIQKMPKGDAEKAIPKLQEIASKDKVPAVRKKAQETITKIQGG